ncbi:branched-chain amino acid ABC transporter permease [Georgenia thermotolerans]|uniref:Branched-chain amino acid ABC transporter permease n=1 Tax=Georgenia thermotolerans TaxID=527326 RepID=A0A7J5UUY8_9MICO|nr:branched-chain amino acid ABC transporter permease [Georgenia thermotolerans]KAE8766088.1 branched-chain amino acid ABC transporter permease [Georgenia thermotolerans]
MNTDTSGGHAPARPGLGTRLVALAGPLVVVYVWILLASLMGGALPVQAEYALVNLVIVVGLQIFIGNSGVLSFGHVAFVAVGAWIFGLMVIDPVLKANLLSNAFPVLIDTQLPLGTAVVLALIGGGVFAAVVAPFLMRANGLQAGIATFALLLMVGQVLTYWTKIAPPSGQSMVGIPNSLGLQQLLFFALAAIVVSWLYQQTRSARLLRASRESLIAAPASGVNVTWHRIVAFALSGAVAGLGGALWAETNRVVQASQLGIEFTFTLIAMLVLGGRQSLWGAVVGTITYSVLDSALQLFQGGVVLGPVIVTVPEGARLIVLGAVLVLVLLLRPEGITGGREFALRRPWDRLAGRGRVRTGRPASIPAETSASQDTAADAPLEGAARGGRTDDVPA